MSRFVLDFGISRFGPKRPTWPTHESAMAFAASKQARDDVQKIFQRKVKRMRLVYLQKKPGMHREDTRMSWEVTFAQKGLYLTDLRVISILRDGVATSIPQSTLRFTLTGVGL